MATVVKTETSLTTNFYYVSLVLNLYLTVLSRTSTTLGILEVFHMRLPIIAPRLAQKELWFLSWDLILNMSPCRRPRCSCWLSHSRCKFLYFVLIASSSSKLEAISAMWHGTIPNNGSNVTNKLEQPVVLLIGVLAS